MYLYKYTFQNSKNRVCSDIAFAENQARLSFELMESGIFAQSIEQIKESKEIKKFKSTELYDFFSDLATYLGAGFSINETLDMMIEDIRDMNIKICLIHIKKGIENGKPFNQAIKETRAFNQESVCFIKSGEKSNALAESAAQAALYYKSLNDNKKQIISALAYPAFIAGVMLLAALFLAFNVLPFLKSHLLKTGVEIPFTTRALLTASGLIRSWQFFITLLISGFFLKHNSNTLFIGIKKFALKLPYLNDFFKALKIRSLLNLLKTFTKGGMTINDALIQTAALEENIEIKEKIEQTIQIVNEGSRLYKGLEKTELFDLRTIRIIKSGEISGTLVTSFDKADLIISSQMESKIKLALTLIEPAMILLLSTGAGFMIMSVMMPLVKLKNIG
jgi:type II secretory pathway component PulF